MEGKVEGSACVCVCVGGCFRVASFEGHGADAELGIETQLSSRAAFLSSGIVVRTELPLQFRVREEFVKT